MSIKKIAKLAGVSIGTVDRILHNRGDVSQKTKEKVEQIIAEIGYKKNIFASNLASNKTYSIGILIPNSNKIEYWKFPHEGIKRAENELKKFNIDIEYFLFDYTVDSFNKTSNFLFEKQFDGIVFAPTFEKESVEFVEKCEKKNIPLITIDTEIKNFNIPFIGHNAYQTGKIAGRLCSLTQKKGKKIIIIKNLIEYASTLVYKERIKGFYDFFNNDKKFDIEEVIINENKISFDKSFFDEVCSIYIPNSKAYLIANYLKSKNIKDINIVGYDLIEENIKQLNQGTINFLINQKPDIQGFNAVNYLYKTIVLQEKVNQIRYIETEIIVKECINL